MLLYTVLYLFLSTPLLGTDVTRCLPYMAGATQGRSANSLTSSSVFPAGEYREGSVSEGVERGRKKKTAVTSYFAAAVLIIDE